MENKILNNLDIIKETIQNSLTIFKTFIDYSPYDEENILLKYIEETEIMLKQNG